MDHFPQFAATQDWPIETPFLCERIFLEGSSFTNFPSTHGWDANTLDVALSHGNYYGLMQAKSKPLRVGLQSRDYAAFLQGWWYFGMLTETLGIATEDIIAFVTRSPTSGRHVVSTQHLLVYIQAWRKRLEVMPSKAAYLKLVKAMECINHVHRMVENLANTVEHCTTQYRRFSAQKPKVLGIRRAVDGRVSVADHLVEAISRPGGLQRLIEKLSEPHSNIQERPPAIEDPREMAQIASWAQNGRKILTHELEVSICVLGHTLSHAIRSLYSKLGLEREGKLVQAGWYTPTSVRQRMIAHDVCPRLITRLTPILLLMGNCFASALPPIQEPLAGAFHAVCTPDRCAGDYEPEESYGRLHATSTCTCEDLQQHHTYAKVQASLERGSIPVLRVHGTSLDDIRIEVLDSTAGPYVAISHVWSDGLGNNTRNQIYKCQWLRLQSIVLALYRANKEHLPFWLDPICVPLAKTDGPKEVNERKRKLRDIAIDRMRATYWNADAVLILDSTMLNLPVSTPLLEMSLRFSLSKWMRRVWTLHEGAVAARVAIRVDDDFVLLKSLSNGLWEAHFTDRAADNVSILTSLGVIECLGAWSSCLCAAREDRADQDLFTLTWNQCRDRGTARSIDRYVVFAIIIGLSGQKMYDPGMDDRSRLEYLLKNSPEIPAMILFTLGPRMDTSGMGWAPASIEQDKIYHIEDKAPAILLQEGLVVRFEGYRLSQIPNWSKRWERSGLFTTEVTQHGDILTGVCTWLMELPDEPGTLYTALFRRPGHAVPFLSEKDELFIILCPIRAKDKHVTRAVLAKLQKQERGVIYVKYLAEMIWAKQTAEQVELLSLARDDWKVEILQAKPVAEAGSLPNWCVG